MSNLDSFAGPFAITEHNKISEVLTEFLVERFYDKVPNNWVASRQHILSNISIEDINQELNDIWEGPGSISKVKAYTAESRAARVSLMIDNQPKDKKKVVVPTVDSNLKVVED